MAQPGKILIVDDDAIMRRVLQNILSSEGYQLEFAGDGPGALNQIAACSPDLVLLDVMLPGMNGFAVCRKVRSDSRFGDVPIIFVTARDDDKSRLEGIEAGADEFLAKPVNAAELRARVKTVLDLQRLRRVVSNRSKFEKIIELAPEGILVVDVDANIRLSNQAIRNMLKVTDDTAIRLHKIFHYVPREFRDLMGRNLEDLLVNNKGPLAFELSFKCEDGATFPAEVTASYFPWEAQPCVQIYVRNVEDKKLIERQFLRMQRMQSIGTLAGGIAHDLNNALTPIMVATHLARSVIKDGPAVKFMDTIEKSAMRGRDIIKQILAFARGVEGERRLVQLKYVVKEIEKILHETLPPNIEVSAQIGEQLSGVIGDSTQIHQVLMNLCVNARDAMSAGGALSIDLENENLDPLLARRYEAPAPGAYVRMSVTDTGTGISKEDLDKIFEPFFTTKEIGVGTGLGLSSSLGIVRSHGGFITVDSEPGRGTSFHVFFPAAQAGEQDSREYETTFIRKGQGERVLVVDDEPAIREMIEASLKHYGYSAAVAENGEEALRLFKESADDFKVVMMDFLMPGVSGHDLISGLRASNPDVPLILMTGYAEMSKVSDTTEQNGLRFLLKPFTVESMLEALHRALV